VSRIGDWFRASEPQPGDRYASGAVTVLAGVVLAAVGLAIFAALFNLWPAVDRPPKTAATKRSVSLLFGAYTVKADLTTAFVLLALLTGSLGAYIHTATSFATFVGNRTLKASWLWWYALRIFIGAALALVIYFAFRGGLLTTQASTVQVNPYGVAAISGLAGLFNKQATDKLKEVFETLFRTGPEAGDAGRIDKADERRPVITRVEPGSIRIGEKPKVNLFGQKFEQGATVLVDGHTRPTEFVSDKQLTVQLEEADTSRAGSLEIIVKSPPPSELSSERAELKVTSA